MENKNKNNKKKRTLKEIFKRDLRCNPGGDNKEPSFRMTQRHNDDLDAAMEKAIKEFDSSRVCGSCGKDCWCSLCLPLHGKPRSILLRCCMQLLAE